MGGSALGVPSFLWQGKKPKGEPGLQVASACLHVSWMLGLSSDATGNFKTNGLGSAETALRAMSTLLGVDSPFFSTIVLLDKSSPFPSFHWDFLPVS